jgi:acyl carrier protein
MTPEMVAELEMQDTVLGQVRELLAEALGLSEAEIAPEAALIDDLGAESIDFLDISYRLEQDFGCSLPTKEWGDFLRSQRTFVGEEEIRHLEERCGLVLAAADREAFAKVGLREMAARLEPAYGVRIPDDVVAEIARRGVQRTVTGFERIFGVAFPEATREELVALAADSVFSDKFRAATRRIFTVRLLAQFVGKHG